MITVKKLVKRFGLKTVLRGVDFEVQPGEFVALLGPNGAGKTTLLECIAGLLPADAGEIRFEERRLSVVERKESLFYLPDGILPYAEQPLGWVLKFFAGLYERRAEQISELVEALKLQSLLKARVRSLSKGERKRALLAFALLTSQPLLLLDEPFDGLDLRQTRDVMTLLREHVARGRTLLLSIHQLTDAERVCDRFILLSAGKVVGEGSIVELRKSANLTDGRREEIFLALT